MSSASSVLNAMHDHGNFPVANHSLSSAFANATDPKREIASINASRSQTRSIVVELSLALAMAHPWPGKVGQGVCDALVGRIIYTDCNATTSACRSAFRGAVALAV